MGKRWLGEGNDLTLVFICQKFSTEEAARTYMEALRWPNGPVCPHCGTCDPARISRIPANAASKVRPGLYRCTECVNQFTVTVGTVCEDSHIPLNKWLIAFYVMCASKTQVSALQLQRQLELGSYRSALFMCHRIRYALKETFPTDKLDGTVKADETYMGGKARGKARGKGRGYVGNKTPVVSLVERGGRVRSQVAKMVTGDAMGKLFHKHVNASAHLNTDESQLYTTVGKSFASHDTVTTPKRNTPGTTRIRGAGPRRTRWKASSATPSVVLAAPHHNISAEHMDLYFAELDFKYNTRKVTDGERTVDAIRLIKGKRLMLKTPKAQGE